MTNKKYKSNKKNKMQPHKVIEKNNNNRKDNKNK